MDEAAITVEYDEATIGLIYRYADDHEADVLERLLIKAGLRWQCAAPRKSYPSLPCGWVNPAEYDTCDGCGTPITTEWNEE